MSRKKAKMATGTCQHHGEVVAGLATATAELKDTRKSLDQNNAALAKLVDPEEGAVPKLKEYTRTTRAQVDFLYWIGSRVGIPLLLALLGGFWWTVTNIPTVSDIVNALSREQIREDAARDVRDHGANGHHLAPPAPAPTVAAGS